MLILVGVDLHAADAGRVDLIPPGAAQGVLEATVLDARVDRVLRDDALGRIATVARRELLTVDIVVLLGMPLEEADSRAFVFAQLTESAPIRTLLERDVLRPEFIICVHRKRVVVMQDLARARPVVGQDTLGVRVGSVALLAIALYLSDPLRIAAFVRYLITLLFVVDVGEILKDVAHAHLTPETTVRWRPDQAALQLDRHDSVASDRAVRRHREARQRLPLLRAPDEAAQAVLRNAKVTGDHKARAALVAHFNVP